MTNDPLSCQGTPPTRDTNETIESDQSRAAEPAAGKAISQAKIDANRRNAQKSTGPRTAEGKARSRWNAMKHGILSSKLLVFDDEQREAFDQLLESLWRDLSPATTCEQILVEKIAMSYWRLHVAYGFEAELSRTQSRFFNTCDKTGRYANTIHRQLMQDMHELERLQRRRSGEAVPAPISMDINLNPDEGNPMDEPINSPSRTPGTTMPDASAGTGPTVEQAAGDKRNSTGQFWPNEATDGHQG